MGKPNFAIEPDSGALWLTPDAGVDATAEFAAQFIPAGARVLDLGCAAPALRDILPHGCAYIGSGKVSDDLSTIRCDVMAGEFPVDAASGVDIILALNLIEQVADADALFAHLQRAGCTVLISCNPSDLAGEAAHGANHRFGFYELTRLFDRHGFRIECSAPFGKGQMMMRLAPEQRIAPLATLRAAVISGGDEFGERVGRQMIASILPGEAAIDYLTFGSLDAAASHYDLVVAGVGGGLDPSMINGALLDVVDRGRTAIGLFGTQYRELIPRAAIETLIERLDVWFARHEADVLMYGRGRDNVVHLGDWVIDQFPLAQAGIDEPLLIGGNAGAGSDLAHTVVHIQRHKRVFSAQTAALLCALTAAETAAYSEPPNSTLPGVSSGEFHGLLIDIFGRSYPEKDFFLIDRDAVMRYKARVHGNIAAMRERIAGLLRAGAVAAP